MRTIALLTVSNIFMTFAWCGHLAADSPVEVSRVEGRTLITRGPSKTDAEPGDKVLLNDVVETDAASKLDVVWGGAWGCRILESSRIRITGTETEDQRMELEKGGILLHFKAMPKKSEFRVFAPAAIASVRGTEFMVKTYEGKEIGTTIAVLHGTVTATSITTELRHKLRPGEAIDIPLSGKRDFLRPITDEERALLSETSRIRTHFGGEKKSYAG